VKVRIELKNDSVNCDKRIITPLLLHIGSVGKTSLFLRFTVNKFNPTHETTLQASYQNKRINLPDGKRANLAIWDTAGQERFHSLGPIYYRDSNGAILVYDITDRNSFVRVQNWVKELRKMLGKDIELAIVGNKIDLEANRVVTVDEAEKYAASVGAKHYHTSAKLDKGIAELFLDLTKRIVERESSATKLPTSSTKPKIIIEEPTNTTTEKGGCCKN
jgi:Ras-related protein Rab-21